MQDVSQNTMTPNPFFEQVSVPPGQSYLWRLDDYPWRRSVWNYHPEFEIHLIRHSTGLAYVGDYIGEFGPGQLVLIGSNLPHNWVTPGVETKKLKGRDIVVQFAPEFVSSLAQKAPEFNTTQTLFEMAKRGVEFYGNTAKTGQDILESMNGNGGLTDLSKLFALLDLLSNSTEARPLASKKFIKNPSVKGEKDHMDLEQALDYIQRNFLEKPTLSDVASLVGMSDSAFSRFFKLRTGNTFSEHTVSLRLWMARKLLTETEHSITDICFESGFNNISHFNKTFSRKLGMTPSKYRKAAKQHLKGN